MSQEKRSLLAGFLSLVVLLGWYFFFGSKMQPPPASAPVSQTTAPETPFQASTAPSASADKTKKTEPRRIITRETPLMTLSWTNHGGHFGGAFLKKYRAGLKKDSPPINLLGREGDKGGVLLCRSCNFSLPDETEYAVVSEGPASIVFEGERNGIGIRKEYTWSDATYLVNLKASLRNRSGQEIRGRLGLGWVSHQAPAEDGGMFGFLKGHQAGKNFIYDTGKTTERGAAKDEVREIPGAVTWAGVEERYFLGALISRRISADQILRYQRVGNRLELSLFAEEAALIPDGSRDEQYSLYLGPKESNALESTGVGLEKSIDYGWFAILAFPILKLLQIFHGISHNWGVAIILLTIFIKILMNPLTIKSMKQMKEMQKLQPKLAALKEKYKNDRQRLNTETMQLFKSHSVNPMGGCLPMLLQMPIYIVLYKVIDNSIELYHAPFFWFYRDLSAPDPYFILPVLLGVSMVLQQKMTPNPTADPAQKQIMMIMPVMFTAFMLFLPLGLVVYIFVNTVFSVLQQWMHQKDIRWRDLLKRTA